MLYLVAADGKTLDSKISKRFGQAAYHLLINPENLVIEAMAGDVEQMEGHGLNRVFELRDSLRGVIAGNVGPHAFQDIHESGWPVYIVRGETVQDAVRKVYAGEIPPSAKPTMKRSVHEHQRRNA